MAVSKENISQAIEQCADDQPDGVKKIVENLANKIFEQGILPKDALGFTDDMVEGLYGHAYRLYNNGKYKEAGQLFRLLIMLNPTDAKYTLGLAACFHMQKDYPNAAVTYELCGMIDANNPIPHYHLYDCYLHMEDKYSALSSLNNVISAARNRPEYLLLIDRCNISLASLRKEIEEEESSKKALKEEKVA